MITLYTTGCPRCMVLEKKLAEKGIIYSKVSDENKIIELGIMTVPLMSVDGNLMEFGEAIDWINNYRSN